EACWILYEREDNPDWSIKAFEYAERGKALMLRLAANSVLVDAQTDNEKEGSGRYWRQRISALNAQYLNADTNSDSLLTLLTSSMEAYKLYQDSLQRSGGRVLQEKYQLSPSSIQEIRMHLLKDDQTLLEFEVTPNYVFQF